MPRHLRSLMDLSPEEVREVLDLSRRLKIETRRGVPHPLLAGKSIALIFHKPSLRTKVSFEVAITELGGSSVVSVAGRDRPGQPRGGARTWRGCSPATWTRW